MDRDSEAAVAIGVAGEPDFGVVLGVLVDEQTDFFDSGCCCCCWYNCRRRNNGNCYDSNVPHLPDGGRLNSDCRRGDSTLAVR